MSLATIPRVSLASAGSPMTPAEFDAIVDYDDRYRYELIHGVLVVSPLPSEAEGGPNEELGRLLLNYRDADARGAALDGTLPERYVRTSNRRRADRVIWAGLGRRPKPKVDIPTIVVEFVSPGRANWKRDYVEKRQEYLDAGVLEYWIIDRVRRMMTVCRRAPLAPAELVLAESGVYQTDLLPGFTLPLATLLAAADRWSDLGDDVAE